jgi:hypothetical protein
MPIIATSETLGNVELSCLYDVRPTRAHSVGDRLTSPWQLEIVVQGVDNSRLERAERLREIGLELSCQSSTTFFDDINGLDAEFHKLGVVGQLLRRNLQLLADRQLYFISEVH